jgi:hypothetical protein
MVTHRIHSPSSMNSLSSRDPETTCTTPMTLMVQYSAQGRVPPCRRSFLLLPSIDKPVSQSAGTNATHQSRYMKRAGACATTCDMTQTTPVHLYASIKLPDMNLASCAATTTRSNGPEGSPPVSRRKHLTMKRAIYGLPWSKNGQ